MATTKNLTKLEIHKFPNDNVFKKNVSQVPSDALVLIEGGAFQGDLNRLGWVRLDDGTIIQIGEETEYHDIYDGWNNIAMKFNIAFPNKCTQVRAFHTVKDMNNHTNIYPVVADSTITRDGFTIRCFEFGSDYQEVKLHYFAIGY